VVVQLVEPQQALLQVVEALNEEDHVGDLQLIALREGRQVQPEDVLDHVEQLDVLLLDVARLLLEANL